MSRKYHEPNPNYFPMQEYIKELEAENARLKAEVDALKAERELKNAAIEVILNAAKQGGHP